MNARLFYTIDFGEGKPYEGPFHINNSTNISAFSERTIPNKKGATSLSAAASSSFVKIEGNRTMTLETTFAQQYSAGGEQALVDGLRGGRDFRTGQWQGYEGEDLVAAIDLGEIMRVERIGLSVLQDQRSWIWLPENVQFAFSFNGRQWSTAIAANAVPRDTPDALTTVLWTEPLSKKARYIKVIAKNAGPCPEWHPGNGGTSWIFADEVLIEGK